MRIFMVDDAERRSEHKYFMLLTKSLLHQLFCFRGKEQQKRINYNFGNNFLAKLKACTYGLKNLPLYQEYTGRHLPSEAEKK